MRRFLKCIAERMNGTTIWDAIQLSLTPRLKHFVCKACGVGLTQAQTLRTLRYDAPFGKGARLYRRSPYREWEVL